MKIKRAEGTGRIKVFIGLPKLIAEKLKFEAYRNGESVSSYLKVKLIEIWATEAAVERLAGQEAMGRSTSTTIPAFDPRRHFTPSPHSAASEFVRNKQLEEFAQAAENAPPGSESVSLSDLANGRIDQEESEDDDAE